MASTQTLTFGTEQWNVTAPDDTKITQANGVLKIDIQYNLNSLVNGQFHGIDTIDFEPVNDGVASGGLRTSVEFDITNSLPVPVDGFDLMLFNNTPATGPLDIHDPTGHPDNYAHFHNSTAVNGTGAPFAPLTVTTFLPDFSQDPHGFAPTIDSADTPPSELRASGTLQSGQTVTAKVGTMHSVEVQGAKNGFGINFFPTFNDPNNIPPMLAVHITGQAVEDSTLAAVPVLYTTDADKSVQDVTYQWQRSEDGNTWNDIANATNSDYHITAADDHDELRVVAKFVDDSGDAATATSDPTASVFILRHDLMIDQPPVFIVNPDPIPGPGPVEISNPHGPVNDPMPNVPNAPFELTPNDFQTPVAQTLAPDQTTLVAPAFPVQVSMDHLLMPMTN